MCNQLLQFRLYDTFMEIEMLCSRNDRFVTRENLVQAMFMQAVKQDEDAIALHMSVHFTSLLRRSTGLVVPILLSKMQKDPTEVSEVKLSLLQRLQPNFHFKHADLLVHILETVKNDAFKPEGSIL